MKIFGFQLGRKERTYNASDVNNAVKRAVRAYGGAQFNRLTADWFAQSTSQDSEVLTSLRALRNRTRQLVRDNDYAKNAVRTVQNNVVGRGIGLEPRVLMQRGGKLNTATNQAIKDAWAAWGKKLNCDVAGKLSFTQMQRIIIRAVMESGEVFVRKVPQKFGKSRVPFALEIIEADQLIDDYSGHTDSGNIIKMGVELDKWSRPVAYWFYPHHPGDYTFQAVQPSKYMRIPADEILHLGITDRPGQTRFVPWFHTALKRLHNLGGFEEAEIVAARASAAIMGFIESPDGDLAADATEDGQAVTDLEPGQIKALMPGESFKGFNPSRPGTTFDPFVRAMIRGVCAGIGASYESVSKDYSQSNYSSSRLALLDDRDNWTILQDWMIEDFLQPVFEEWLMYAELAGVVTLAGYATNPDAFNNAIRWKPRGWQWVDPLKEVTAAKLAVRSGFRTLGDIVSEGGEDLDDVLNARQAELQTLKDKGIVTDTDPAEVDDRGQSQNGHITPAAATPGAEAVPADQVTEGGANDNADE